MAAQWSDEEVVGRWLQLCPEKRGESGKPCEPTENAIATLLADLSQVAELRKRLSSISWMMKFLNEWIAKRANAEDEVTGHFFQERFGCRSLLDEGAILACSIYVDLNEIRAMLAKTPETSKNTSAYFRILARIQRQLRQSSRMDVSKSPDPLTADPNQWLCPINEQDREPLLGIANLESVVESRNTLSKSAHATLSNHSGADQATVRKQWRHGFLGMTLEAYLDFLDWNARQFVLGKSGVMDEQLPPILDRLGITPSFWMKMIENFERWFHGAAGSSQKLAEEAARTGRHWLQGIGPMRNAPA